MTELSNKNLREQICDICHRMWQKGWVAANDGNVSVKLPDGTFFATPTGMSKSFCILTDRDRIGGRTRTAPVVRNKNAFSVL